MSAANDRDRHQESPLLDDEISTARADRRSFLARAVGGSAGVMALLAMSAAGCESSGSSDECDADVTDDDPTDLFGGDPCDSD